MILIIKLEEGLHALCNHPAMPIEVAQLLVLNGADPLKHIPLAKNNACTPHRSVTDDT